MLKNKLLFPVLAATILLGSCSKDVSYETNDNGLRYHFYTKNEGAKAKVGDFITLHFLFKTSKDSVLRNTWKEGNPIPISIQEPGFKGDLLEGLQMVSVGDSVAFQVNADSLFKKTFMAQRPAFIDSGSNMTFVMKIIKIQSKEEFQTEQTKQMEERKAKMEQEMANQKNVDDKTIQDYVAANNLKTSVTPSGLHYLITKKGKGANAAAGKMVTVKYVGKLLNGTVFDPGNEPFEFTLGAGQVIPGWDEGISLLNPGSTATFIIPSRLGYGPMQMGDKIPANSVLLFEVELQKVK